VREVEGGLVVVLHDLHRVRRKRVHLVQEQCLLLQHHWSQFASCHQVLSWCSRWQEVAARCIVHPQYDLETVTLRLRQWHCRQRPLQLLQLAADGLHIVVRENHVQDPLVLLLMLEEFNVALKDCVWLEEELAV
jgi:hypothetical protein